MGLENSKTQVAYTLYEQLIFHSFSLKQISFLVPIDQELNLEPPS